MPLPRTFRDEALVLESRPSGEADLLLTLFGRESGKIRAVARGARKTTSKMVGHLEPLNRVDLLLARSKDLDYVTQVQAIDSLQSLKASLEGVAHGLYLAELVRDYTAEGVANPHLFDLLLDTLAQLPGSPEPGPIMRCFELHLLKASGFMPQLYRCAECALPLAPGAHRFSPEVGGAICSRCAPANVVIRPLSLEALKVLRFLDRSSLQETGRLKVELRVQDEVKALLTSSLTYWLDREVRSQRFLEHLQTTPKMVV